MHDAYDAYDAFFNLRELGEKRCSERSILFSRVSNNKKTRHIRHTRHAPPFSWVCGKWG